ncbi:LmbU family transcriptional regulator [Kitasatospora sp. NPDC056138]|uniref:LmbU family transcriptional regulator n=1 Tax=Kitasatospora sp. NPDC056138 TaxID=3345724 RepID=UPI0035D9F485
MVAASIAKIDRAKHSAVNGRQTIPHSRIGNEPAEEGSVLVTRVGLRIVNALAFNVWEQAGLKIARAHDSSAWCLGDWIVYGQSRYENRYREAVDAAGLDYQTIRNYAWVARRFELARRRSKLSFQHHAEVASLAPSEQDGWLDRAEREGWSRNELRRQVRGRKHETRSPAGLDLLRRLEVTPEQAERWREAATRSGNNLQEWILAQLDEAACSALRGPDA